MIKYRIGYLLAAVFMALLFQEPAAGFEAGRTTIPEYSPPLKVKGGEVSGNSSDELIAVIREIATTLQRNMEYPDPVTGDIAEGLLVTTFVELDDLYSTSSFGRYLAEQLVTEFQQHRYNVVDIRKSRSILIKKKKGEFGFSRKPSEIRQELDADGLLGGTYMVGPDDVLINARILENKTGRVLAAAVRRIPRTPVVDEMLRRSSSAEADKGVVMYMKELGR